MSSTCCLHDLQSITNNKALLSMMCSSDSILDLISLLAVEADTKDCVAKDKQAMFLGDVGLENQYIAIPVLQLRFREMMTSLVP
jgi:hypothetical protein